MSNRQTSSRKKARKKRRRRRKRKLQRRHLSQASKFQSQKIRKRNKKSWKSKRNQQALSISHLKISLSVPQTLLPREIVRHRKPLQQLLSLPLQMLRRPLVYQASLNNNHRRLPPHPKRLRPSHPRQLRIMPLSRQTLESSHSHNHLQNHPHNRSKRQVQQKFLRSHKLRNQRLRPSLKSHQPCNNNSRHRRARA